MYKDTTVGVVIRAFNEENFISQVINSIPAFVDKIYVVNDASTDRTLDIVLGAAKRNEKLIPVNRLTRGGAGSAAVSGHQRALEDNMDIIVIMDGDGQMDPRLLKHFIDPIAAGKADYVKGNRLSTRSDRREMPVFRIFGNFLLTNLTRIASGYWHVSDPQNGYTAISANTLRKLSLSKLEKGFAFENDMLVKLNLLGARVMDIPHSAVYFGQKSKIRYFHFIYKTSWVLLKDSIWRYWVRYIKGSLKSIFSKTYSRKPSWVEKQNPDIRG